jgi:hypothetical protein
LLVKKHNHKREKQAGRLTRGRRDPEGS